MAVGAVRITDTYYLVLAAMLFTIGAVGLLVRRNVLVMFMCVELMLNAVNLTFVTFARAAQRHRAARSIVFFTLVVAAAEVAVGLAIIVAIFRRRRRRHRRRRRTAEGLTAAPMSSRATSSTLVWLVPALPLLGAVVAAAASASASASRSPAGSPARCSGSRSSWSVVMFFALLDLAGRSTRQHVVDLFTWFPAGGLQVDVRLPRRPAVDHVHPASSPASATLIHLYSIGYMHGDPRFSRFFAYLNLFVAVDADPRPRQQLPRDLPRVGGRRPLLLPAHLVLVRAPVGGRRRARRRSSPTASATSASCSRCS